MTGRVCAVHGEWCPTGVCRWCEKQPLPGLKGIWQTPDRVEVNEAGVPTYTFTFPVAEEPAPKYMSEPVVVDPNMGSHEEPVLVNWGPTEKTADAYVTRLEWAEMGRIANVDEAPPINGKAVFAAMGEAWDALLREAAKGPVSRQAIDTAEESRLLAQHAALRWERVARRWEGKHRRTLLDVAKQWQTKWNFDLKCALRILERHNPLLRDAPWKEPKR